MDINKITDEEIRQNSVVGMAEVPGLPAQEMQYRIEQLVREIAIPKINEVIEYIAGKVATQEDLEKLLIDSGSVTSVFGRAGAVVAKSGDYTPEMVGAAAKSHAKEHAAGGKDPIEPVDIGAAEKEHVHGNITADGKIGSANGMVLMTGIGGKVEAKAKADSGFVLPPEVVPVTGEFTAQNNKIYFGNDISDFIFNCDSAKAADCRGFVTFGTPGKIELKGFDFVDDSDDIKTAKAKSRWEFDLSYGCLIIRKRSE
ncbi:MAG: hypothetical protein IIX33_05320 [Oscillospiraceae bacterium]|nr:hypothetical protein [Oscillospiraceae bacterium]